MRPAPVFCFEEFALDPANRTLLRAGAPLALNARYFDALALLVREHGKLVSKQRLFEEVWGNTVVTDAALTQCIKEIRRVLGDNAADPRFVRTVPGHGYCFIAAVTTHCAVQQPASAGVLETAVPAAADAAARVGAGSLGAAPQGAAALPAAAATALAGPTLLLQGAASDAVGPRAAWARWLWGGAAATIGGAAAGLLGGALYGSVLAFSPDSQALGSLSVLLVLLVVNALVGMAGALGVGFGLATGRLLGRGPGWLLAGGSAGGLLVGGLAKLLGSDAFSLLVGQAPAGITGGLEGAAIGLALAAGLLLGGGPEAPRATRPVLFAAATTALAGGLIPLLGGSMMASSLARMATSFEHSRLDLAPLGQIFGAPELGALAQSVLGAVEGAIFGGCVVAALLLARRHVHGRNA